MNDRELLQHVKDTLGRSLDKDFGLWSASTNERIRSPVYRLWKQLDAHLAQHDTTVEVPRSQPVKSPLCTCFAGSSNLGCPVHGLPPLGTCICHNGTVRGVQVNCPVHGIQS